MKRSATKFVLAVLFVSGTQIACHQASRQAGRSRVVLPNPELLSCRLGECAHVPLTVGARPGADAPWRVTIERLGNDPCANGIVALYDKNVSMEQLMDAVTGQYGPAYLKGASSGGTWKDPSKNLVISLLPLADKSGQEAQPSSDATQDPTSYSFTTDEYHDAVGRSVPRKELKELIILSKFGTSCGVPTGKPK